MAEAQRLSIGATGRGLLARPLDTLVFLLPLLLFYEVVAATRRPQRLIASDLLRGFVELFGPSAAWIPALVLIAILLATHLASRQPWTIHWRHVGLMYVESLALALPLLALNWAVPLSANLSRAFSLIDRIAVGIGAGLYEELLFRLILISLMVIIAADVLRLDRAGVAVAAVLLSSLFFAAHHYQPLGQERMELASFAFRTVAGLYLGLIFWYRGYGVAAGSHAAYNVVLILLGARTI